MWFCTQITHLNYESTSLWVAVVSLALSIVACLIGWSFVSQAIQVAERDRKDWKQRKWFDLYFSASEIYDSLDRFSCAYSLMHKRRAKGGTVGGTI